MPPSPFVPPTTPAGNDAADTPLRHELRGHPSRSTTTIHGWASVAFGLPFVVVGVVILARTLRATALPAGTVDAPSWIGRIIGGLFAAAGVWLVANGARDLRRRARLRVLVRRYPDQPWMWDYAWDRLGGRDGTPAVALRSAIGALFIGLFLVPFNWLALTVHDMRWLLRGIVALLDAGAVAMVGYAVYLVLRLARYGVSHLQFGAFPMRPGDTATLTLLRGSGAIPLHPLRATLRCVQERYEVRGSGRNRQNVVVCYALYEATRTTTPPADAGAPASLAFDVPGDAPGTALGELPPRYWELELRSEMPGIDYGATFLVPIYRVAER